MATDVLKYILLAGAVVGGVGAFRTWRLRRWQMKMLRKPKGAAAKAPPP